MAFGLPPKNGPLADVKTKVAGHKAKIANAMQQLQANQQFYHGLYPMDPRLMSERELEVRDSEILAWRGWVFDKENEWEPVLMSINYPTRWEGPSLTADIAPTPGNSHGIYALKQVPRPGQSDGGYFTRAAFGEVALSGIVVEGERGYRGQHAIIRSLWVANPNEFGPLGERFCAWEIAGMLEERYGVDVQVANMKFVNADYQLGGTGGTFMGKTNILSVGNALSVLSAPSSSHWLTP